MNGFRLGAVFGIEIRIDPSWFIIFFLILWTFTAGVFPATYPGLDATVYVAMGTVGTLLFFASVLAHELAHSLVALRKGIPVEGITLFIFGGMARTRMEFETPGDEFVVAGVGPLSSFMIAAMFYAIGWVSVQAGWSVAIAGVAFYLALVNVVLAVFNLLPGFPLDGGRMFRAGVWKLTGDLTRATRAAASGGKILGFLLMGFGVMQLFAGVLIGGMWAILIGWFLRGAAEATMVQHVLRTSLRGVRAATVMTPDPDTVPPDLTVQQLVEDYLLRVRHQAYPVDDDGRPIGIVSLGQLKEVPREEWPTRTVRDVMTPLAEAATVSPYADMTQVLEAMEQSKARRVLVVHEEQLAGIITSRDVTGWLDRAQLLDGDARGRKPA